MSNVKNQLHECIVLPSIRPDLFQGIQVKLYFSKASGLHLKEFYFMALLETEKPLLPKL
jgi:hypothetical protein